MHHRDDGAATVPAGVRPAGWKVQLPICLGDGLAAVAAALGALWIWSGADGSPFTLSFLRDQAGWLLLAAAWLLLLRSTHRSHLVFSMGETAADIARAVGAGAVIYMAVYFLAPRELLPRLVVLNFLVLVGVMTLAWRVTFRVLSTMDAHRIPVAVVGSGAKARSLAELLADLAPHKKVVAFVEDGPSTGAPAFLPAPVSTAAELGGLAADRQVSELFLAPDGGIDPQVLRALVSAREQGVDVVTLPAAYEHLLRRLPVRHLEPWSVVASLAHVRRTAPATQLVRRAVDVLLGCAGCAAFLVLLPLLGAAVWFDVGFPIFFRQERIGLAGRPFRLLKLRTMSPDAEHDGPRWAGARDPRASGFGRFLRRSHLDEIPQFWNVLRGEMSLVGPRPERPEFVDELARRIPCYRERLLVRPGLTGWAQVNYRYASSVDDALTKLEYDLYYIKHRSLWLDAAIVWRTLWTLVAFSGR